MIGRIMDELEGIVRRPLCWIDGKHSWVRDRMRGESVCQHCGARRRW